VKGGTVSGRYILATLASRIFACSSVPTSLARVNVDDVVILIDDSLPRNCWSLGRVVEVFPGRDDLVRSVRIKTSTSELTRPISKMCLPEARDT